MRTVHSMLSKTQKIQKLTHLPPCRQCDVTALSILIFGIGIWIRYASFPQNFLQHTERCRQPDEKRHALLTMVQSFCVTQFCFIPPSPDDMRRQKN